MMTPSLSYTAGWVVWLNALLLIAGGCSSNQAALGDDVDGGAGFADADITLPDAALPAADANPRPDAEPQLPTCTVPGPAIVTDIDATLTTSDTEWLLQMAWGSYEPAERPGGADLISAFAARGYYIVYLTARPDNYSLAFTNEPARAATLRWLQEHGYPVDPERTQLSLAPQIIIDATATTDYKSGVLTELVAEGFTLDYAYGNAATDISAYEAAGIAKEHTFIIGPEAGTIGTVAIAGDGWVEHTAAFLPTVDPVCEP